jgi:hypothetical protein
MAQEPANHDAESTGEGAVPELLDRIGRKLGVPFRLQNDPTSAIEAWKEQTGKVTFQDALTIAALFRGRKSYYRIVDARKDLYYGSSSALTRARRIVGRNIRGLSETAEGDWHQQMRLIEYERFGGDLRAASKAAKARYIGMTGVILDDKPDEMVYWLKLAESLQPFNPPADLVYSTYAGIGQPRDTKKAFDMLDKIRRNAELQVDHTRRQLGRLNATLALGWLYWTGTGVAKSKTNAVQLFLEVCPPNGSSKLHGPAGPLMFAFANGAFGLSKDIAAAKFYADLFECDTLLPMRRKDEILQAKIWRGKLG